VTTKLIVALYGDATNPVLHGTALRDRLAVAGCTAVQVNVDDADVAPAMRFGPGDPAGRPITAFVTVWTEDIDSTRAVLTGLGDGPHVYQVTEHRRLDPPAVPDGERADALTNIAVLRRPDGMSQAEYLDYWLVHHTPIAIRTQATFGYIQNAVDEALTEGAPAIASWGWRPGGRPPPAGSPTWPEPRRPATSRASAAPEYCCCGHWPRPGPRWPCAAKPGDFR
jgi:hypothetical protein